MNGVDFSKIATKYEDYSSVQKSAAEILLNLLKIGNTDDVLDLGCGVGNLTRKIKEITSGKVVGIDPSEGMIKEAIEKDRGLDIAFEVKSVEELNYRDCFNVIFCNSSLQWFREPQNHKKQLTIATRLYGKVVELEYRHQLKGYIALIL